MKTTDEKLLPLKNGDISKYSLFCGYVQNFETKTRWKKIYRDSVFHVMSGNLHVMSGNHCKWDIWETFELNELTKARKFYHSIR